MQMPDITKQETQQSSEELMHVMADACEDVGAFCLSFLPDNFYQPFSSLHDVIIEKMNDKRPRKKTAVCATRGIGKTTLARGKAGKGILFADFNFIVYLSKSATHAEFQTENLKKDLMGKDIRDAWFGGGSIKTKAVGDVEESWSKKTWVANVGNGDDKHYTLVLPRGAGQQVRGLLWKAPDGRNVRPDLIICDDLEDSDPAWIENEDNRRKLKEWFFADVVQCFGRLDKNWEIFYIDTLKHHDSLMQVLLDASDWDSTVVSICDENYKSLAPEFMSDKEIADEVESYREKGLMDIFAREIMCMPISKEDAVFRSEYFQYYDEGDKEFLEIRSKLINIVIIDPAKTAKRSSAESGFIVWGVDPDSSRLYLRYAAGLRLHPDQINEEGIRLCRQYNARVLGIESTGLGEFATYPLANAIIAAGANIEIVDLKAKKGSGEFAGLQGGKKMRIASLQTYYRKGQVYHNKVGTGAMEIQLLGFPRSKRWDIMDAAAYITEMLDMGEIFFTHPDMMKETRESVEQEYTKLEEEMPRDEKMPANWRTAP